MDYFGFNNMDDELFKKEFLRFLNQHQQKMNNFMKRMYGFDERKDYRSTPDDFLNKILNKLNNVDFDIQKIEDETGLWEKKSWQSPDGYTSYTSFTRDFNPYQSTKENKKSFDEDSETIELLKEKLNHSIEIEDYESAAKIRDLIKTLEKKK